MRYDYLNSFVSMNRDSFKSLIKQHGFVAAACYQIKGETAQLVLSSEDALSPSVFRHKLYFKSSNAIQSLLGFEKITLLDKKNSNNSLAKFSSFYFPEQSLNENTIFFALKNATGKRTRFKELDGLLEATANKISFWIGERETKYFISDVSFMEQLRLHRRELQDLLDHELRTPMSGIQGYSYMLKSVLGDDLSDEIKEYLQIIESDAKRSTEAIDKISTMLESADTSARVSGGEAASAQSVKIDQLIKHTLEHFEENLTQYFGESAREKLRISFRMQTDKSCMIKGQEKLLQTSFSEVLKNACKYSSGGDVVISLYRSDAYLVVDIEDDGEGVSEGTDDLIFLRFFKNKATRIQNGPQSGLGVGLFIARYITEQHFGQLSFVRTNGTKGVFRFIWPVDEEESSIEAAG